MYRHESTPSFKEEALNTIMNELEKTISMEVDRAKDKVYAHFQPSHIIKSEGVIQVVHQKRKIITRYLVAWRNDKRAPSWFTEAYFERCPEILEHYRDKWQRDLNKDLCYLFTLSSCPLS